MADIDELNWDDLRYFLLAVRARTLAGAARAAGVQHTTIGRRLTALERSLGAPLFRRGPEGLALTPLGETLVPLAHDVERAAVAVRELAASRRARVRVSLPSGFIAFFADELARFGQEHPELTLETFSSGHLLDLRRGEADLAVRVGPVADEDLVARSLGDVGWSLYASPRYLESHPAPSSPEDLAGHKVIAYGAELAALPAAQWLEANAAQATMVLSTNDIAAMVDATISGLGIGMLPCLVADTAPGLMRLTPKVLAQRRLSLVYPRELRVNESVRKVASFLVETMRSRAGRISGSK